MSLKVLLVDFENLPKVDLTTVPDDVVVPFFFGASQRTVSKDFLKAALKLGGRFLPIDIEGQGKNALDFHIAFYLGEYLSRDAAAHCAILSRDKGFDPLVRHLVGRGFAVTRAVSLNDAFAAPGVHAAAESDSFSAATDASMGATRVTARAKTPRGARSRRGSGRAAPVNSSPSPSPPSPAPTPTPSRTSRSASPARPVAPGTYDGAWAAELITRLNRRNRPRRRKGLVALLMSRCANQVSAEAAERLVDHLLAAGVVREEDGVLSFPD